MNKLANKKTLSLLAVLLSFLLTPIARAGLFDDLSSELKNIASRVGLIDPHTETTLTTMEEALADQSALSAYAFYRMQTTKQPVRCTEANKERCSRIFKPVALTVAAEADPLLKQLEGTLQNIPNSDQWTGIRRQIRTLEQTLVLATPEQHPSDLVEGLRQQTNRLLQIKSTLLAQAPAAFQQYGLLQAPGFDQAYPVPVNLNALMANLSLGDLNTARPESLEWAAQTYAKSMPKPLLDQFSTIYMERMMAYNPPGHASRGRLHKHATALGLSGPGLNTALQVHAWHYPDLDRDFEFKLPGSSDLKVKLAGLDTKPGDLIRNNQSASKPALLVITASGAEASTLEDQGFEFVESASEGQHRQVRNPAYEQVASRVQQLRGSNSSMREQSNSLSGDYAIFGAALQAIADGQLEDAEEELANTPAYITEIQKEPYKFRIKNMLLQQKKVVNYVMHDPSSNKRCDGSVDLLFQENLKVTSGLRKNDLNYKNLKQKGWLDESRLEQHVKGKVEWTYQGLFDRIMKQCEGSI